MWSERVNRRDAIKTVNLILEHTMQEGQRKKSMRENLVFRAGSNESEVLQENC